MFKFAARRRGFTLIELMIVIIVIAILALIVIPKLAKASLRAKESAMTANLSMIRSSLEQFKVDMGVYPSTLVELAAANEAGVVAATKAYTGYQPGNYHGPYLSIQGGINGLPKNPLITDAGATAENVAADATPPGHWAYAAGSGTVTPGKIAGLTTVDGNIAYGAL